MSDTTDADSDADGGSNYGSGTDSDGDWGWGKRYNRRRNWRHYSSDYSNDEDEDEEDEDEDEELSESCVSQGETDAYSNIPAYRAETVDHVDANDAKKGNSTILEIDRSQRNSGNAIVSDINFIWEIPMFAEEMKRFENESCISKRFRSYRYQRFQVHCFAVRDPDTNLSEYDADYYEKCPILHYEVCIQLHCGYEMGVRAKLGVALIYQDRDMHYQTLGDFDFYRLKTSRSDIKKLSFDKDMLESFILEDGSIKLSVHVEVIICENRLYPEGTSHARATIPQSTMLTDLKRMCIEAEDHFADLAITVAGRVFHAHRNILTTRSSYFKAALEHDMVEKQTGKIELKEIDADTFKEILEFMYTDNEPVIHDMDDAMDLYLAADRFDLGRLRVLAEEYMTKYTEGDNLLGVLQFAHSYNITSLRSYCIIMFSQVAAKLKQSPEWLKFEMEYPELVAELAVEEAEALSKPSARKRRKLNQ